MQQRLPGDDKAVLVQQALALHQRGDIEAASNAYRQILAAEPDHAEANHLLGLALHQSGRNEEAVRHIDAAVRRLPFNAVYHSNLGAVYRAMGRHAEAVQSFERSLLIDAEQPPVLCNLGLSLLELGHGEEAVAAYRRALALQPNYANAHHQLAAALASLGRLDEARTSAETAVRLQPASADANYRLGRVLMAMEKLDLAAVSLAKAVQLRPDSRACADLGKTLVGMGKISAAVQAYAAAIATDKENPALHFAHGKANFDIGRFDEALASFSRGVELNPNDSEFIGALGAVSMWAGQLDEAEARFVSAIALDPNHFSARGGKLLAMNYRVGTTAASIAAEAAAYGQRAEAAVTARTVFANTADPDKRLLVGLLSGDLREHAVANFLKGLIASIDTDRIELVVYSTGASIDGVTQMLRRRVPAWRTVPYLTDEQLDAAIIADGIDILVDVSGHTDGNRLPMLARKPAPVLVTWLGYSGTTGLTRMDYILGDDFVAPQDAAPQFSETIWRLPDSYLCYTPPDDAPEVAALPALSNGYVTFGSFNNVNKLSPPTLALWGRVLAAVPNSRLLLKQGPLDKPAVAARIREGLAAGGADLSRVDLKGYVAGTSGHLGTYGAIDIGLDPFPYNGTTTTCEALWMGVPVLTLRGDRFIARVGESLLTSVGLPDWVAADAADYVAKAAAMATNIPALVALRSGLRPQMAASPLCDAPRFARHFEDALRQMWAKWCAGQGAGAGV